MIFAVTTDISLANRVKSLLETELEFIPNDAFLADDAETKILADDDLVDDKPAPMPPELPAHLARLCETQLLGHERERVLFRRMNYLKFRVHQIRATLDPTDPDLAIVEQAEEWLSNAEAIRNQIINANMRLVMSIVKKFVTVQISFDDLLSDGIWSLMQCVDKFNYDKGFRFSTYAYRSIARAAYRQVTEHHKEAARTSYLSNEDANFDVPDEGHCASMDEHTWARLRALLSGMMQQLDPREQFVISGRYALGTHHKVCTFQSLADKLGVSKERVRQLEQRAVNKLKKFAEIADRFGN